MNRAARTVALAAITDALPSVTALRTVRVRACPSLAGYGDAGHVALSFDDGPDPRTTPAVAAELARLGVRATFFVLGERLAAQPALGQQLVAGGHEIAVHGWTHRPHLLRVPGGVALDLRRTHHLVRTLTGRAPRFWRPPHGITTASGLLAAHALGMRAVLWGCDGREWRRNADAALVIERLERTLRPGATVLLHDADSAAPPGTAQTATTVLSELVARIRRRGWQVGPLCEHGFPPRVSG